MLAYSASGLSGGGFDLTWHTIDGGAETSSGVGGIELAGTIGQPDSGTVLTGGGFELTGGFWAAAGAVAPGDRDGDGDVDLDDYAQFPACMTGPDSGPYDAGCDAFDFEFDGDVDLGDFATLQEVFTGSVP
jgi:hypothetical protein